jgi:hypothetical protein
MDELDREIEMIRTERFLRAATPGRPTLPMRASAGIGRALIALGVALGGDGNRQPARRTRTDVTA